MNNDPISHVRVMNARGKTPIREGGAKQQINQGMQWDAVKSLHFVTDGQQQSGQVIVIASTTETLDIGRGNFIAESYLMTAHASSCVTGRESISMPSS